MKRLPITRQVAILTSLLCALPVSVTAVESVTLAQHGAWVAEVDYYPSDNSMECSISARNAGDTVILSVDAADRYRFFGFLSSTSVSRAEIDLELQVGAIDWTLRGTTVRPEDNGTFFTFSFGRAPAHADFVSDLMRSEFLSIPIPNRQDIWFSLRGSAAAVRELESCRQKISR